MRLSQPPAYFGASDATICSNRGSSRLDSRSKRSLADTPVTNAISPVNASSDSRRSGPDEGVKEASALMSAGKRRLKEDGRAARGPR